jgi:hypothetical protein
MTAMACCKSDRRTVAMTVTTMTMTSLSADTVITERKLEVTVTVLVNGHIYYGFTSGIAPRSSKWGRRK